MVVGDEVANVALDELDCLSVVLREGTDILVAEVLALGVLDLVVRNVFVKDKSKDIVLVFVGFDFRPHLVSRFPDLGGELLFVHGP